MKKRSLVFSVLAMLLIALLVTSCTVERTPENPTTPGNNRQTRFLPRTSPMAPDNYRPNVTPGQGMQGPMTNNNRNTGNNRYIVNNNTARPGTNQMGTDMQDRAEKLADVAAKQKEVESASCLITGNTAMVGLQFNNQYKGKLTDSIKKQVDKRVREADKRIDKVVVTADPDMVSRIEEIFQDIGKGRPISGFTDELKEMINRINPK